MCTFVRIGKLLFNDLLTAHYTHACIPCIYSPDTHLPHKHQHFLVQASKAVCVLQLSTQLFKPFTIHYAMSYNIGLCTTCIRLRFITCYVI